MRDGELTVYINNILGLENIGQLLFSVDMPLAPQDDRFGNPEISSSFTECEI